MNLLTTVLLRSKYSSEVKSESVGSGTTALLDYGVVGSLESLEGGTTDEELFEGTTTFEFDSESLEAGTTFEFDSEPFEGTTTFEFDSESLEGTIIGEALLSLLSVIGLGTIMSLLDPELFAALESFEGTTTFEFDSESLEGVIGSLDSISTGRLDGTTGIASELETTSESYVMIMSY